MSKKFVIKVTRHYTDDEVGMYLMKSLTSMNLYCQSEELAERFDTKEEAEMTAKKEINEAKGDIIEILEETTEAVPDKEREDQIEQTLSDFINDNDKAEMKRIKE